MPCSDEPHRHLDEAHRPAPATLQRLDAPFTADQVVSLNDFQTQSLMHPFTCGQDSTHGSLIATTDGWCCPIDCGYTQHWAHAFMADDTWRQWRADTERLLTFAAKKRPAMTAEDPT